MGMKSVRLVDGSEVACNQDGRGVFTLGTDGSWVQHVGTLQTPVFRNGPRLMRWVRGHLHSNINDEGSWPAIARGSARGWEVSR